jgi:hypothetical protein
MRALERICSRNSDAIFIKTLLRFSSKFRRTSFLSLRKHRVVIGLEAREELIRGGAMFGMRNAFRKGGERP